MSLLRWSSLKAIRFPSGETRAAKWSMGLMPGTGVTFPARSTHTREDKSGGSIDPGAYTKVPAAMLYWAAPDQVTPALPYRDCVTPSSTCTGVPDTDKVAGSK